MSRLIDCIGKAGKAINKAEADSLLAAAKESTAERSVAERNALENWRDEITSQYDNIKEQARYAIQKQSPGEVLQRQSEQTGEAGSGRGRVEPSVKGNEPTRAKDEAQIPSKAIEGPVREYTKQDFVNVGRKQRGAPESAMSEAADKTAGVMSYALEHTGDLIHRMSESPTFEYGGYGYVKDKVQKVLRTLLNKYGFEREFNENLVNNAKVDKTDLTKYKNEAFKLMQDYADAHKKLVPLNEAQRLAQEASVSLGERRYSDTVNALEKLNSKLTSEEEWTKFAHQGLKEGESKIIDQPQYSEEGTASDPVAPKTPAEWILGKASPVTKQVAAKGPTGKTIADAVTAFRDSYTRMRGTYVNDVIGKIRSLTGLNRIYDPVAWLANDNAATQKVLRWFWNKQDGAQLPTLNTTEKQMVKVIQDFHADVLKERNAREGLHKGGEWDAYLAQIPDYGVIREVFSHPDGAEAKSLKQDFIDYQVKKRGQSLEQATKNLDIFIKSFNKQYVNVAEQYGPLDKAAGMGIPESWRNHNLVEILSRYGDRVSRRFAYYDKIQQPEVQKALNTMGGDEDVRFLVGQMTGVQNLGEKYRNAAMGIVRSMRLGPLTGARDLTSSLFLGMQYQESPIQTAKSILYGISHLTDGWKESFSHGVNRHNLGSLEFAEGDTVNAVSRIRDVLGSLSGRNVTEQLTRAIDYGMGKFTAIDMLQRVQAGRISKQTEHFFKTNAEGMNWRTGELTPKEINEIAARYVENVQGKYDYTELPKVAIEGSWSPYLSLSRWNIGKMNNFMAHVVNPVRTGNFRPLLMASLGGVVGGTAVNWLTEQVTGRKNKSATLSEIAEGDNKVMPIAYKLASLADASGYTGIAASLTKMALDKVYAGNRPQEVDNILWSSMSDFLNTTAQYVGAMNEEIDYTQDAPSVVKDQLVLTGQYVSKILEDNLQAYRLILAHISEDKGKTIDLQNKRRDLKIYQKATGRGGEPVDTSAGYTGNPFADQKEKEFKKEEDLGKAAAMQDDIIKLAIKRSTINGQLDMNKLTGELNKLKAHSYNTMPGINLDNLDPIKAKEFADYQNFLAKTQGPEEAANRTQDYLKHNYYDRVKAKLVPTL